MLQEMMVCWLDDSLICTENKEVDDETCVPSEESMGADEKCNIDGNHMLQS